MVAFLHILSCIYYLSQRKTTYRQRLSTLPRQDGLCGISISLALASLAGSSVLLSSDDVLLGLPKGNRQLARGLIVSLGGLRRGEGVLFFR
jgi:hypothetical protein